MDESEWGDSDSRDLAQSTGVWALRIAVLVVPFAFWPGIIRSAGLPKLAVVLVLSLVLASSCLTVRRVWLTRRAAFLAPLLVYLLITAAQAARCSNPAEGLLVLAAQTAFAMVCATTACLVRPGREMSLIRFSAVAGIGVACMGILEHLGVSWSTLPSAGRPSATFGFRNTAAAYLAINLPLSAALWLETRRRDWVLGAVSTGLMLAFLMLTRTRGAWVGLSTAAVIGLLVALWMRARAERSLAGEIWSRLSPVRRCAIAGCLALGLAMAWLPAGFADRGLQRLDEKKTGVAATVTSMVSEHGDRGRLRVWRHSLEMIADRPMIGVGLENWSVHYPRYDRGDVLVLPSDPQRPHNDFLWIWSELGTVGLLVYLWFLFVVGIEVVRRLKEGEEDERALALFLGVAMLAYLGHSVFS
ncbi:MAG: O-antigen ligase family protein, partial [Candidatus Latescibacteria bacterium]|nr:O-antigen ligase family protein [Candidatus Latescibacterota bacterium]